MSLQIGSRGSACGIVLGVDGKATSFVMAGGLNAAYSTDVQARA